MKKLKMSPEKKQFNRRFATLKKQILKNLDLNSVYVSDTASVRWDMESCIVAHDGSLGFTIYQLNADGSYGDSVQITKADTTYVQGLKGIHVRETDFTHLSDAIETAFRDRFEKIYVKSILGKEKS